MEAPPNQKMQNYRTKHLWRRLPDTPENEHERIQPAKGTQEAIENKTTRIYIRKNPIPKTNTWRSKRFNSRNYRLTKCLACLKVFKPPGLVIMRRFAQH